MLISSAAIFIILLVVVVLLVFHTPPIKDIEITVLDIHQENERFYVNVSITNNQDAVGWVDDAYLVTVEGSTIGLTGAGIDETIEPGTTRSLTFLSIQINGNIVDPPLKLEYTAFPSETTYTVLV